MVVEDRIARLESDVVEIKVDLKTLGKQFVEFKMEVSKEFASVRAEAATEFASVRAELQGFQTSVAREFGSVGIGLESLRTSIERTKVWMLGTGIALVVDAALSESPITATE